MVALTADRRTAARENRIYSDPMAANVTIYKGAIVVLDAAGNATRGTAATGRRRRTVRNVGVEQNVTATGRV